MAAKRNRITALLVALVVGLTLGVGSNTAFAPAAHAAAITGFTLTDSNIALSPTGNPREWKQVAPTGTQSTKLTATFGSGSASYSVDGGASVGLTTATASAPISLNDGLTTIVVTHTDGPTVTTYTLYVLKVRLLTGIEVEGGTLSPAFDPDILSFTVTLPHDDTQTRIRATWDTTTTANATGFEYGIDTGFGGVSQTPGAWSGYGSLGVGDNYRNLLLRTDTPQGWVGGFTSGFPERYQVRIIRADAFTSIGGVTTSAPAVGTPVLVGTAVTATPLSVTGIPAPTVTYDWQAADDSSFTSFETVATTESPTWTPDNTVADLFIRVNAVASNGLSVSSSALSAPFGPIAGVDEAPAIVAVSITGNPITGSALVSSVTGVTGYPRPTITYQWQIADDSASAFTVIAGEASNTYTPIEADLGRVIRVQVTASNGIGSPAVATSTATNSVTAPAPPGGGDSDDSSSGASDLPGLVLPASAPLNVTGTPGNASVVVSWSAPASQGSFPVTKYHVMAAPGGASCLAVAPAVTCKVTGLTNGSAYTFKVKALNGVGWSSESAASAPVTPQASPTISITGERRGKVVVVSGRTTGGLEGQMATPWTRFRGQDDYTQGKSRRISDGGTFMWSRKTGKTIHVYFTVGDLKSSGVKIRGR